MKNFRFYAEMPEAMKSKKGNAMFNPWTRATLRDMAAIGSYANVVAVFTDIETHISNGAICHEGYVTDSHLPNSGVAVGAIGRDYLRERCTHIDATTARKLHPSLFARIDADAKRDSEI